MVVTTQVWAFTDYKIYPGRGMRYVSKDWRVFYFINKKSLLFFRKKTKNIKVNWTLAWRKHNNKGKVETRTKRKARKQFKKQKDIEGLDLNKIKELKKPEIQTKLKEEAIK